MTARDDAIKAVQVAALTKWAPRMDGLTTWEAAAVVDAVEPIIRADVEAHNRCHCTSCIVDEECLAEGCQFDRSMTEVRERLRAQVEALTTAWNDSGKARWIRESDVLALLGVTL